MNSTELFEAIGKIDSDLITRCENEVVHAPKQTLVRWLSAAACLCLMIFCIFTLPILSKTPSAPITPGNHSSQPTTPNNNSLYLNQLEQEPSFQNANISLNVNDFVPMTDSEFLKYYGVSFSINQAVPALELQPQSPSDSNGIFKNSSRGTYYDSHTFVFSGDGNTQRIEITLSETTCYPGLIVGADESNAQPKQSEIGGFAATVFQYAGEDGGTCYYTEFLNNGIAYCITSYHLSQENYVAALTSVIADNVDTGTNPSGTEEIHTVTGTVNVFDGYIGLLSISSGDGAFSNINVYLPDGYTNACSVGDKVEISYTGNPITIGTIWAQQLNSINKLEDRSVN